jgi:hypothetical protein
MICYKLSDEEADRTLEELLVGFPNGAGTLTADGFALTPHYRRDVLSSVRVTLDEETFEDFPLLA